VIASVPDAIFVVAGYGVILVGIAVYAVTLVRRLRRAERAAGGPEEPASPER
jgi:CcmD family protein